MAGERDDAARLADDSLAAFIAAMAAAGNPGSGRHELGMHHVKGWVLEYDPAIGGAAIQSVIGLDGAVHALREPRSLRTQKLTASEWVQRAPADATTGTDPMARATSFAGRLAHILEFDGVGRDGDQPPAWNA